MSIPEIAFSVDIISYNQSSSASHNILKYLPQIASVQPEVFSQLLLMDATAKTFKYEPPKHSTIARICVIASVCSNQKGSSLHS